MKIYSLKDEIDERDDRGTKWQGVKDSRQVMTNMKQGVKNPERVNIFTNGKFLCSLDVAQVVDFRLKVGRELSDEELMDLKRASEFGKLYQRVLEWVLMRPRSERETRDYVYKKIFEKKLDKKYIDNIISRLKNKRYLDDRKFAKWWVENRFVKKGVSQKRLSAELTKKGVTQEVIDEVLGVRDEETEITKIIAKKRVKYPDDQKLLAYLIRQGFSYELAREKVESHGTD